MNPFSLPFTPDPDAKRNGKIAHLPRPMREKLNQLLYEGQPAVQLAAWLNELSLVKTILANHFGGRPISPQNISEWRQGGYRDWLAHQQLLRNTGELAANARELAASGNDLADSLFGLLTLDYAQTLMHRDQQSPEEFEKKRQKLSLLAQDIVRLRRCHLNARRVELQEERLDQTQEKTTEQLFDKFVQWASIPAIRKAFILAPQDHLRQLRQLFDLPPRPEDAAVEKETQTAPPPGPSGRNQTKIKPHQTKKSRASTPEPLSAGVSPRSNEPATGPMAVPSPGGEGQGEGELNIPPLNNDPNEPDTSDIKPPEITSAKTTAQLIAEMEEYAARITARKNAFHQKKLATQPSSTHSQAPTENSAGNLCKSPVAAVCDRRGGYQTPMNRDFCPSLKFSQPTFAEVSAGVQSISPGLERGDYPGLESQLDLGSMPEASRVPMESGRAHLRLPSKSQPPLSDYEKARLEGKSHLEALYAQFTPTPEELERRKRENEELRHASEPSGQTWTAPVVQSGFSHPGTIPPSKFYGPCPSPYHWQGSRLLDPWKVHTT